MVRGSLSTRIPLLVTNDVCAPSLDGQPGPARLSGMLRARRQIAPRPWRGWAIPVLGLDTGPPIEAKGVARETEGGGSNIHRMWLPSTAYSSFAKPAPSAWNREGKTLAISRSRSNDRAARWPTATTMSSAVSSHHRHRW